MLQEIVKFFINPVLQFSILVLFFIKQKKPGKVLIGFIFYFYLLSIPMTGILFYTIWSVEDTYDEEKLKEYMQWDSIEIEINLKLGNDAFKCYTCDFTHDYIDINSDYRN